MIVHNPYAPDDVPDARITVLIWNEHWYDPGYDHDLTVVTPSGARIALTLTRDRSARSDADAIWFHFPTTDEWPTKLPGERWVLASMEAETFYPLQGHPISTALFDVRMTHQLGADVPCPYVSRRQYGTFDEDVQPRSPTGGALACFIASHRVPWRDRYVGELMEHVPIDSYGTCLNNRRFDDVVPADTPERDRAAAVIEQYPFYLAFENCREVDYVTEKLYRPLASGTVPIYCGAPNVVDFVPSADAVIVIDDDLPPRALAEMLLDLAADPHRVERHRAAARERSATFEALLDLGDVDPRARLATKLAHRCDRACGCGGREATGRTRR